MDRSSPGREKHLPIFETGAIYIENLTNLEEIPEKRAMVAASPPAIKGLEGVTIRLVAFVWGKGGLYETQSICHPPPSRSGAV